MTGGSFADWKGYRDGGSFESRRQDVERPADARAGRRGYRLTLVTRSCAPSGRATSK